MKERHYYASDFENTVPKADIFDSKGQVDENQVMELSTSLINEYDINDLQDDTRVWGAGIGEISDNPEEENVTIVGSMSEYFKVLRDLPNNSVVYFHNLQYDGHLLIPAIIRMGFKESLNGKPFSEEEKEKIRNDKMCLNLYNSVLDSKIKKIKENKEYTEKEKAIKIEKVKEDYSIDKQIEMDSNKRKFNKNPNDGEYMSMVTGDGVWYSLKIRFPHTHRCIEFRDSLKILPFSVDRIAIDLKTKYQKLKGTIDYTIDRPYGYKMTEKERKYLANDILVMMEALYKIKDYGLLDNLTIASACLKHFKTNGGEVPMKYANKDFRNTFPVLSLEDDEEIRKSYRGGWCYNHTHGEIYNNVVGNVYDVNSLYPSVMFGHRYPIGKPKHSDDLKLFNKIKDNERFYYFVKLRGHFVLKEKHLPFIQIKKSIFNENEYIVDSDQNEAHEPVEITLTKTDYELFLEHYHSNMEIVEFWVFNTKLGIFDEYISYWYNMKSQSKKEGNKVLTLISKLFLNSLYGKMAMGRTQSIGHFTFDDKGKIKIVATEEYSDGVYIPIGSAITSYAKNVTIRAAQMNYEKFLYSDTDSIHIIGTATGIEVDPYKLGAWDNESSFDKGRFVRQKTYIEHTVKEGGKPCKPFLNIKACGATDEVKKRLLYKVAWKDENEEYHFIPLEYELDEDGDETKVVLNERRTDDEVIERFTYGLSEAGKLTKKRVKGGSVLYTTTFNIRKPVSRKPVSKLA